LHFFNSRYIYHRTDKTVLFLGLIEQLTGLIEESWFLHCLCSCLLDCFPWVDKLKSVNVSKKQSKYFNSFF
jgi:hypothetical protein